jgi:hypothetical protein
MKYDYSVHYDNHEHNCNTLKEARKDAKELSKELGEAYIYRWMLEDDDAVLDEFWQVKYEDGKEVKVK